MPVRGRTAGNSGRGSKWISKRTRRRIYARDGWRCVWCACAVTAAHGPTQATLDHVVPRHRGGHHRPSNLVTACMRCNRERGSRPMRSFAALLQAPLRELRRRARNARRRKLPGYTLAMGPIGFDVGMKGWSARQGSHSLHEDNRQLRTITQSLPVASRPELFAE